MIRTEIDFFIIIFGIICLPFFIAAASKELAEWCTSGEYGGDAEAEKPKIKKVGRIYGKGLTLT